MSKYPEERGPRLELSRMIVAQAMGHQLPTRSIAASRRAQRNPLPAAQGDGE